MANRMLSRLRGSDKKGLFTSSQTSISYSTGFTPLDYKNGYLIEVRNRDEELLDTYSSLGVVGGTFITIVGKTGTAKTTLAAQIAANIVRQFEDDAWVQHYDLEQALSYTRIKKVTNMTHAELDDKYVLKQEKNYIEDIFEAITDIALEKEKNRTDYMYDTGRKDEFGRSITCFKPTVIILDSIPTVASNETDGKTAMEGGTYANRVAKALSQFYKKLMPIIKTYNITVIAINHINSKIEINPMMKTQPQILTLKMDESIPGGNAPLYYANNIFKLTSIGSEKFTVEEDGFDGFVSRLDLLKARTNKSGQFCELVYNQVSGFDPCLTQLRFASTNGLVGGRNPYRYLLGHEDKKFDSRKFGEVFNERPEVRAALFGTTLPVLEKQLRTTTASTSKLDDYMSVVNALVSSQENEMFEEKSIVINADTGKSKKVAGMFGWDYSHLDYLTA